LLYKYRRMCKYPVPDITHTAHDIQLETWNYND